MSSQRKLQIARAALGLAAGWVAQLFPTVVHPGAAR